MKYELQLSNCYRYSTQAKPKNRPGRVSVILYKVDFRIDRFPHSIRKVAP